MALKTLFRHIWECRPIWLTLAAFIFPCGILRGSEETELIRRCAYVVIVMAILWLTEALPIPVTSLFPIILFPMAGVASAKEMSAAYISDTSMLFLGGLIIAVAMEESGLHMRISLLVMSVVGAQPVWLMLGLASTTWFLSMWISNTAATAMMVPIIKAVIKTIEDVNTPASEADTPGESCGRENEGYEMSSASSLDIAVTVESKPEINISRNYIVSEESIPRASTAVMTPVELQRLGKGFALCVAYGANIGGIATLTGTPPNLVLKNKADELYMQYMQDSTVESPITFARWFGFAFPLSLIILFTGWLWLAGVFLRKRCFKRLPSDVRKAINSVIKKQYKELGRISLCELQVLLIFILLVIMWLFRSPPNIGGWGSAFKKGMVSDSTPCILLSILLFILPAKRPNLFCYQEPGTAPAYTPILTWQTVVHKLPWGVIVLLGGGFALASACVTSGFSAWIGDQLKGLAGQEAWVMNFLICVCVDMLTELTSNTATATLLLPILASLAMSTNIHPLYLMMSTAISCSFAFMLPVATPPNAIVFSTGIVSVFDMFTAGIPMNIISVLWLTLGVNTWGRGMFDLDNTPDFFLNSTATSGS